jgi:hypothetical protein
MSGIVEQADEQVSIITVCQLIGMDEVADEGGRATKYHCPFAEFYHNNPTEKAFRVYPETNSAFCFGGCGFFSPVMLYAKANDFVTKDDKLRLRDAANALMKVVGYAEPSTSSWDALANPKPPAVNTAALGKALEMFTRRTLAENPQADPLAAAEIFAKMENILPSVKSAEDATKWMDVGQQAIRIALKIEGSQSASS